MRMFFNRALHWVVVGTYRNIGPHYILTFDLTTHAYGTIFLPKPNWETRQLTIVNGYLAVIPLRDWNQSPDVRGAKSVLHLTTNGYMLLYIGYRLPNFSEGDTYGVYNPETGTWVPSMIMRFQDSQHIDMQTYVETLELLDTEPNCVGPNGKRKFDEIGRRGGSKHGDWYLIMTEICKVPLAIGKHYNELVTCDVIDIEVCHVLLGRPWQHDMDVTHQGKSNMYLFRWSEKTIAMLSLSVISRKMKLENKTLATLVASPKEFQAERKKTRVSYALVMKGVKDVIENAIPVVNKPLLAEFGMIVTDDTLDALPPLIFNTKLI
ncbi:hypothetical protein Tco_1292239 [Tanacetum coccineum]